MGPCKTSKMPRNRNTKRSRRSQARDVDDTEDLRPGGILYPQSKVYTISQEYKNQIQRNRGYESHRTRSLSPFRQAPTRVVRPQSPPTSEGERSEPESDASVETVIEANQKSRKNWQNRYKYRFYPPPMRRFPSRATLAPLRRLQHPELRPTYTLTLRTDERTQLTGELTGKLYAKIPEGTLIRADSQTRGETGRIYQETKSSQTEAAALATFQAHIAALKL
jgi:hypothetical protein